MLKSIKTNVVNFLKGALFFAFLQSTLNPAMAQVDIPIGTWRSHFSYFSAHQTASGNGVVYCASTYGMFYFDLADNSTNIFSKVNGLSDTGISAMQFNPFNNTLLVGYENGNIDLISDDGLSNFSIIKEAETDLTGFNEIDFSMNEAFLSMDLGLVLFDMEEEKIIESYSNIGPNGTPIVAYSSSLFLDSIYIASDQGILAASFDEETNRLDFRNWYQYNENIGLPSENPAFVKSWAGSLIAGYDNTGIYLYDGDFWTLITNISQDISSVFASNSLLYIVQENQILTIDQQLSLSNITNSAFIATKSVTVDSNNDLWVADNKNGLLKQSGANFETIRPSGPFADEIRSMINYDGKILALSGYISSDLPTNNLEGFSIFENGTWTNYNSSGLSGTINMPSVHDLVDVVYNDRNNTTYFASFGMGVLTWDNETSFSIIDENTPGSTLINSNPSGKLTRISSLGLDFSGNLWMCNYGTVRPLHVLTSSGDWQFYFPENAASQFAEQIMIPSSEDIWMRIRSDKGGRISLLNPETGASSTISRSATQGQIVNNNVLDMLEDFEGRIWIGSFGGINYFQTAFGMVEADPKDFALRPIFDGFPLLADEEITALALDGGDRKWIGTDNGLWLFGSDGETLYYNFTEENSPLPSNRILDIAIEGKSGEVFISTDKGLVSFRGTSTEGEFEHDQVKIFPNPVKKDFTGTIGISGLASDAIVKITNISGKLVYETRAFGGTATWDGRDYNGRRASTGIYLVLSSNRTGEQTFVGKIAVID